MALIKERTKKRKGENAIGKIIYGFLLFMPLFAVLISCMYVVFNKNAYQSYSGNITVQRTLRVENTGTLAEGQLYTVNIDMDLGTENISSTWYRYSEISIDWTDYGAPSGYNYASFEVYKTSTTYYLYAKDDNDVTRFTFWNALTQLPKTWAFKPSQQIQQNGRQPFYLTTTVYTEEKLDNVFYYQLEKLEQSDLFNWSKNTGTYTVLHNTTTLLGISNEYTPMLLAYWLLISVMYFIYDIALILVWAVHDKIHELKDSI